MRAEDSFVDVIINWYANITQEDIDDLQDYVSVFGYKMVAVEEESRHAIKTFTFGQRSGP